MLDLPEIPGVFCDAHLVDEAGPRFLSLWGRDTAMQEFLARLSLPERDGGLRAFRIGDGHEEGAKHVPFLDPDRLLRESARRSDTVFGEMIHVWLMDRILREPDHANGRALLLRRDALADDRDAVWDLLRETLWIPVLDHWRDTVLDRLAAIGCIKGISGYRVHGTLLDLARREEIESCLSSLVRDGHLPLEHSRKTKTDLRPVRGTD